MPKEDSNLPDYLMHLPEDQRLLIRQVSERVMRESCDLADRLNDDVKAVEQYMYALSIAVGGVMFAITGAADPLKLLSKFTEDAKEHFHKAQEEVPDQGIGAGVYPVIYHPRQN